MTNKTPNRGNKQAVATTTTAFLSTHILALKATKREPPRTHPVGFVSALLLCNWLHLLQFPITMPHKGFIIAPTTFSSGLLNIVSCSSIAALRSFSTHRLSVFYALPSLLGFPIEGLYLYIWMRQNTYCPLA